jgi:putative acetyltransferase
VFCRLVLAFIRSWIGVKTESSSAYANPALQTSIEREEIQDSQSKLCRLENRIDRQITVDVHNLLQGKGVASALNEHLLEEAKTTAIKRLYVEASLIAKSFFEHPKFSSVKKKRDMS